MKDKKTFSQVSLMGILGVASCVFLVGLLSYWTRKDLLLFFSDHKLYAESGKESAEAILFLDCLGLIECILLLSRYEWFGQITVSQTAFVLCAPFRRVIKLDLSEICCLGIDYGDYSGQRRFWIYLGKEALDKKYYHQIHRASITQGFVKMQYSQKLFDFLAASLPRDLSKRLRDSTSVIRLFSSKQSP